MIQFLFSLKKRRSSCACGKQSTGSTLHLEFLEARYVFAGAPPVILENWQSAIFDDRISGTLPIEFERNVTTVDPDGTLLGVNQPRFGDEELLSEMDSWTNVLGNLGANTQLFASGWDHDGETPVAVLWSITTRKLTFVRGYSFTVVRELQLPTTLDLFGGQVSGYRYVPETGIVNDGLIVLMLRRDRRDGANWIDEGVSFAYTQDLGQSFQRIAQVGGGFDVPALPGGVTDGLDRTRSWSFANAFPEKSADDVLGAWFPWADYLQKSGGPKGGQIGLFRARRAAVGQPWVVEANVTVYETWREDDSGGFHAHTAGMFVDGMVSFWGDVSYRNRMVRHVAADLENYTTTTWTHEEEFQGGWSPSDAPVHNLGNQATSAAPGPVFGEVLVAGDEQVELLMKVQRPDNLGEKAIITDLRGSFPGVFQGGKYAGRISQSLQQLRGVGYVATELSTVVDGTNGLFYSPDGEHWAELADFGGNKYFFGNKIIAVSGSGLYSLDVPNDHSAMAPLLLNPGGFNLASSDPVVVAAAAAGNTARRVLYVNGVYVYQDTLQPLNVQPNGPPPVAEGMPMWEFTATGTNANMGTWELSNIMSESNKLHWLSAWNYSLDGNGISPSFRIGDTPNTERESVWVTNSQWVPTQNYNVPGGANALDEQRVRVINGTDPAPRRWLTAIEGFTQGAAPTYPLAPGGFGSNELASAQLKNITETWSTALTFGLPEQSSFSTHFDPSGNGTMHTVASIYQSLDEHIDINFTKTATSLGVISIDVYSGGILLDRLAFRSIYFDREDQIRLVLSSSPDEFGVTLLVTRNGFGIQSKSLISDSTGITPTAIRLSNASRTIVEPMEWYAIQFSPTQALTTAEREAIVKLAYMFERLDAPPEIGPPGFDNDEDMDGRDFLIWQRNYGITQWAVREDGDANQDGRVDEVDLAAWQAGYGIGGPLGEPNGDFNQDGSVDALDLAIWQANYGTFYVADGLSLGDGNRNGNVDGPDFLLWQREYTGPASVVAEEEFATVPLESAVQSGGESEAEAMLPAKDLEYESMVASSATGEQQNATGKSSLLGVIGLPAGSTKRTDGVDVEPVEFQIGELILLKKYSVAIDAIHADVHAEDSRTLSQIAEDDTTLFEWGMSADLAIENWRVF